MTKKIRHAQSFKLLHPIQKVLSERESFNSEIFLVDEERDGPDATLTGR